MNLCELFILSPHLRRVVHSKRSREEEVASVSFLYGQQFSLLPHSDVLGENHLHTGFLFRLLATVASRLPATRNLLRSLQMRTRKREERGEIQGLPVMKVECVKRTYVTQGKQRVRAPFVLATVPAEA